MISGWAIAVLAAGCGRVGFDHALLDGSGAGDVVNLDDAPGSLVDDVFTAGETASLVIDRETQASYFDATGRLVYADPRQPRFDHDPVTHESLGLLVEAASTNATHYSEKLDDGGEWFVNGNMAVTANVALAPDGAMSADALDDQDNATFSRRAQSYVIANDQNPHTCSAFVKAGTLTNMTLGCELLGGSNQLQIELGVDLAGGVVTATPAGGLAFGLEPVGDGWFRAWIALKNNASGNMTAVLSFWSQRGNDATIGTYLGWGAQFEVGQRPTSYIPNSSLGSIFRDGERARLFVPPSELSRGSVRVAARPAHDVATAAICLVGVGSDRVCVERDPTADRMSIAVVGANTARSGHGAWSPGTTRWGAFTYDALNVEGVSDNGTSGASWTLTSAPSKIVLGADMVSSGVVHLQRVTFWTTRIAAAELAALLP